MPITDARLISVIIPTLGRSDLTLRCIDSVNKQTVSNDQFEIIVVENDARPETTLPEPFPENVRRIALKGNHGTTGSINRGIAESSSTYVLLLNNDIELEPTFLETLLSVIERDERCGFCTGKLVNARDRTRLDGVGDAVLMGGGVYRLGHADLDLGEFTSPFSVLAACGAATLFRRSVVNEAGGLDEDFFAYVDDVDLALRARLLNYSGTCVPQARALHVGSATLQDTFHPKIVEWLTRNQILLIAKNYPGSLLIRLLPRIIAFQSLWFLLVVYRGKLLPYCKGVLGALRLLPRMLRKRRRLMNTRKISVQDFLGALRASEQQVFNWHQRQNFTARSKLLKVYFALFSRTEGPGSKERSNPV